MMEKETKRKPMIKKIAVIFLVTLLILTFFSNTIMNYSLPEVATEPVTSGTVSNKVRGQGIVETNSDYEVMVSGARIIKEVKVEAGDEVKKGQVLFTFEEGENTELEEAEETLEQMELDYAKSLLKSVPDYASDDLDVQAAKEELQAAIDAEKQAGVTAGELESVKKQVNAATKEVSSQQAKVDALQEQIDAYGEIGDYETAKATVKALTDELAVLKRQLEELKQDLVNAGGTDAAIKRDIQNKELEITNKQSELDNAKRVAEALKDTSSAYNKLKNSWSKENKKLQRLQGNLTSLTARLEELNGAPSLAEAQAAVKEKQRALTQLLLSLKDKKEQDALAQQSDNMDMQAAQKKIEKQKETVDKIKKSSDLKEIKSQEDGIVSQIDVKEGDSVTADMALAKIQLAESGFVVMITVTKAQAKLIRTGNEATVENVWDDDLTATVKSVKADPENPNQNMIVTFEVKGNVEPGQTLALSVGEKSNRYDAVVPNNAVKEDSKGKFVLVVTVKGTPLGNRYKVKRADVDVLASDDNSSGVSGGVYEYDNVVTNSSKPLEEGMQVRLVE
ncbi:MAG: HlyD family efflux transporter periplasmic adaptor subunit [Bacteroidales bacterium]|nr:HlyD family efflux transporter periplasmic adaptor subunit [Clostridium sp.]MCM1204476.1 HlyD family efflux transporter periplasmic adaptor subunit [Bacteroidales bacterium]